MFSELAVWDDLDARAGEDNMAVDQALLELGYHIPVLRVYDWSFPTVSFGYFHAFEEAQKNISARKGKRLNFVRRWTGGGLVDHRIDVTYTLIIPIADPLAQKRGAESYRVIHQALGAALKEMGESVILEQESRSDGGIACFSNPVPYDLCGPTGGKLAGAGQRRSRHGLLHQGSVVPTLDRVMVRRGLPEILGQQLACDLTPFEPEEELFHKSSHLSITRYATREWLHKK